MDIALHIIVRASFVPSISRKGKHAKLYAFISPEYIGIRVDKNTTTLSYSHTIITSIVYTYCELYNRCDNAVELKANRGNFIITLSYKFWNQFLHTQQYSFSLNQTIDKLSLCFQVILAKLKCISYMMQKLSFRMISDI